MKRVIVFLILSMVVPVMADTQDVASLEQTRQAAGQGDAEAQLEMGILYEFGYHMPKNNVTALAWYLRSAEQGNALAVKRRDQLKSQMTPEEIDAADKISTELVAKKPEPAKPEPAKPEPAKPEPAKPEPAKPEPAKPEPADTPPAAQTPPPPPEQPAATP